MNTTNLIAGAGIGAALAFMLDPAAGRGRRARTRDKMISATRQAREHLDTTARDISNRARGVVAATRGRLTHEEVDDDTLVERTRSKLGRVCSHPRALDVEARDGEVTLRGPIRAEEADLVIAAVATVRGVRNVVDQLERHEQTEGIPALQGEGRVPGPSLDILQARWAPATRALVAASAMATGACLAAFARRRPH